MCELPIWAQIFLMPDRCKQQPKPDSVLAKRRASIDVKSGFRNAHLSADFPDTGAGFGLFQRKCYLFFGIAGLFHGDVPLCEMEERPETSV